ncbi:MAG: hypothetical protein LIO45_05070, partial [Clostridiales bacterium]|nr:hypothetical protein [Clostridiales bacterium]
RLAQLGAGVSAPPVTAYRLGVSEQVPGGVLFSASRSKKPKMKRMFLLSSYSGTFVRYISFRLEVSESFLKFSHF